MSVERIKELTDRYGAELSHWPHDAASAARAFLATSTEARAVLARAHRLDRLLRIGQSRMIPANLRERILATAPGGDWRELLAALWPFGSVWRPAAALLCVALMGVLLGLSDTAKLILPASVNAALSEEIRIVALSATDVLTDSRQWRE